jgi:hypothetical protein
MNSLIQRNSVGILDLERAWLICRIKNQKETLLCTKETKANSACNFKAKNSRESNFKKKVPFFGYYIKQIMHAYHFLWLSMVQATYIYIAS